MIVLLLVCLLIGGVIYASAYPDSELGATASAVRQAWSGSCRLNCRQSEFSGFSGLGGVAQGQAQQDNALSVTVNGHAGTSSNCVCKTCPCAVIERGLRVLRPAISLYSSLVAIISRYFYYALETLTMAYDTLQTILSCGASCQRQPQLIRARDTESDRIYFGSKRNSIINEKAGYPKKIDTASSRSNKSIIFRDISDTNFDEGSPTKKQKGSSKKRASDVTLEESSSKAESTGSSCSKCIAKGKVCMKNCPRAKNK